MGISTYCKADCSYDKVSIPVSLVDLSPENSAEPRAASSVDLNTSLPVWSNLYLVWLMDEFLRGGASIETSMGR